MSRHDDSSLMNRALEDRRINQLLFYGALLLLGYLLYRIVEPFLGQIGWATVLAICVHPWHERLARRFGDNRGALISTLVVTLLLVLPVVFVGFAVVPEASHAAADIQDSLERGTATEKLRPTWDWARAHAPLPPVEEIKTRIAGELSGLAAGAATAAGSLLRNVLVFLFNLLLTLFILFFLLRDASAFSSALLRLLPFEDEQRRRLMVLSRDLVSASVTASLAVALVQGFTGGVMFAALGIRAPLLWGVVMTFASLIPVVGTGLVWVPAAAWLLLSGETARGLILVAVAVVFLGNVDNVLRPMFLRGRSRLPTVVVFLSLMGGVSAFGFIGIVLGPLVTAIAMALFESHFPPVVGAIDASSPEPAPSVPATG
jgi:predicted PurR-regulated permease PerM